MTPHRTPPNTFAFKMPQRVRQSFQLIMPSLIIFNIAPFSTFPFGPVIKTASLNNILISIQSLTGVCDLILHTHASREAPSFLRNDGNIPVKSPEKRVTLVRLAVSSEPNVTPASRNCSNEGSAEVSFDHMTLTHQLLRKTLHFFVSPHTLPQILLCNSTRPPVAVEVSRSVDLAAVQKKERKLRTF